MKQLIVGLSLFAVACSSATPTVPSSSGGSGQAVIQTGNPGQGPEATQPPTPPAPGANATVPQFTLSGPRDPLNCFTAGTTPMQWVLNVTDAGPNALRFVAVAHQDDTPGCGATIKNPRSRLDISGVTDYTPHSSGQTTLTFDPKMYSCGRVQVDVSIFDATGKEILIIGVVINYGSTCTPPPPSALTCIPPSQSSIIGLPVSFSATGGNGTYSWATPGGTPTTGSGASHTTSYAAVGSFTATVTSGGQTATCQVTTTTVIPQLVCTPNTQTVAIGAPASLTAAGGTGTYSWSAPGGSTTTGSTSSFSTSYAVAGTNNVTVTSGTQSATCQVVVTPTPPPLVCAPPAQTVQLNQLATMTASGGTGTYAWSAPGGSVPTGAGVNFSTSYPTGGVNVVTVTSGTQTATCQVTTPTPTPQLVCAPPTQTVAIGQTANVTATGGTGTYSWSAPGGSTPTGAGASFGTAYPTAGTNTITVTSGAQTATCQVVVPPPTPLVCAPPTQTVAIGQTATMNATGGTGTYAWSAPGGSTPTGAGSTFSTSYAVSGSNTVTVTSGAQTATCLVTVPPGVPPLVCAPLNQTVAANALATLTATGGTGTYAWSAFGGSNTTGTGATFSTSYATAPSSNVVTVTSGTQTANCVVTVPPPAAQSCAGVTATIQQPLVQPTAFVNVNVPQGQSGTIRILEWTPISFVLRQAVVFSNINTSQTLQLTGTSCWPKIEVQCLDPTTFQFIPLANQIGVNQCP